MDQWTRNEAARADRVRVDTIHCFLCHDHDLAVVAEANLRGTGRIRTERARGTGNRRHATVAVDGESGNVVRGTSVQDIEQAAEEGDARRHGATRRSRVDKLKPVGPDAERRNRVAAGVHGEEQLVVVTDDDRALRAKAGTRARASGRK